MLYRIRNGDFVVYWHKISEIWEGVTSIMFELLTSD